MLVTVYSLVLFTCLMGNCETVKLDIFRTMVECVQSMSLISSTVDAQSGDDLHSLMCIASQAIEL